MQEAGATPISGTDLIAERPDWVIGLKSSLFSRGLRVSEAAIDPLTDGGAVPLTLHEYATTGGVTFVVGDRMFVNAPFDEWYCDDPEAELSYRPDEGLTVTYRSEVIPVRFVPLPGYAGKHDATGRLVREMAMSHGDRVRVSPIDGCSFDCAFCDMAGKRYVRHSVDRILSAIETARSDSVLPVSHALISGGVPNRRDMASWDEACVRVVEEADLPVDVMMVARDDTLWIDRLAHAGIHGFAINLEIYDESIAQDLTRLKSRIGRAALGRSLDRAVEVTGGQGRVRSLVVAGVEPLHSTLAGIDFIARHGADPVLSPFRPALGTKLVGRRPADTAYLETLYREAAEITERHGVKLGPRCIPCQHNTLTIPDKSGAYYFSALGPPGIPQ